MRFQLRPLLPIVQNLGMCLMIMGCVACVRNPSGSELAATQVFQNSRRSPSEVAIHLTRFWASVQTLGTTSSESPPTSIPVDLQEEGKPPRRALIVVQKTPASTSTWGVSFRFRENNVAPSNDVTLYLKKSPQLSGPDIHAEWENDDDPEQKLAKKNVWFESLIADPNFIHSAEFKIIFKTLSHAAWVSLDPDLSKYVDSIVAMSPISIPAMRSERDEKEIKTVKIVDFSGRGLYWSASESDWYRKPWLAYEKTDLTPKCDIMGFEKTRIHLVPMNNTPQIARGTGAWKLEISSHFYPFYLPFSMGLEGVFYLEDGSCSLFQKNLERKFPLNSRENRKCIDSLLKLLVNSSPIGKKVDNRIRVIDYLQKVLSVP